MEDILFEPYASGEISTAFGNVAVRRHYESYKSFTDDILGGPEPIYALTLLGAEAPLLMRNPYTVQVAGSNVPHLVYTEVDGGGIPLRKSGIVTPWNIQSIALTELNGVRVIENDRAIYPSVGSRVAVDDRDDADLMEGIVQLIDLNTVRIETPDGRTVSLERVHRLCFYYLPDEV